MGRQIRRRGIAALLAAVLMFTAVPVSADAAGEDIVEAAEGSQIELSEDVAKENVEKEGSGSYEEEEQTLQKGEYGEFDKEQIENQAGDDKFDEDETDVSEDGGESTETEDTGDILIPDEDMETEDTGDILIPDEDKEEADREVTEDSAKESKEEREIGEEAAEMAGYSLYSVMGDDYPAKYKNYAQDTIIDEWRFYNRECTSFAAWRLNSKNGVAFNNSYLGVTWGNAGNWGNAARSVGITVDNTPSVGSIWWNSSGYGHVAWVAEVNGSQVTIEEYNWDVTGGYGKRSLSVSSATGYIHIKDIQPVTIDREKGVYMDTGYTQAIPDGYYHIASSLGDNWWLTIAGMSAENCANVHIWDYSTRDFDCDEQLFYFQFIDEGGGRGFYKITSKHSGKCLDVADGSEYLYDADGNLTNIWQYEDNGTSAQQWAISQTDGGDKGMLYTFWARCSGYCLDLLYATTENGANICIHQGNGTPAQQWRLVPWAPDIGKTIEDGEYQIVYHEAEDKAIGAVGTGSGANIELNSSYKGDYKQTFDVKYLGNGYYSLVNKYTGLSLDVAEAGRTTGTNVRLHDSNGSDAQKWIINSCGDGCYNIISKCSGAYLDLDGGNAEDGSNIDMSYWNVGSANQKWKFIPYVKQGDSSGEGGGLEEDDLQDGVKWHYNEQNVAYRDLSECGKIVTSIKPKTYDGAPYKPTVKVTAVENGRSVTLTEGADYRVLYFNNTHAGTATVTVKGNGVYKGAISKDFEIKKKSCKKLKVVAAAMLKGGSAEPEIYVYDGNVLLTENKDYTLYGVTQDLTAAKGTKQIYVMAATDSDYEGIKPAKITVYDTEKGRIKGIIDNPENIVLSQNTYTYTGKACKPTAVVTVDGNILKAGKDYTIKYRNNKDAGCASATIKGKGSYAGSIVKEFTIKPSDGEFTLKKPIAAVTYNGRLQKPKISVKANGKTLKQNRDYTLSYTNNLHATDCAKVTVRGKGNYADMAAAVFYFKINPCSIKKASVKGRQGGLFITHAKHTLVEGVDYDAIYGAADKKGKIPVTIKAKEGSSFTGEVTKKIKL